jgi:hypothetical protein
MMQKFVFKSGGRVREKRAQAGMAPYCGRCSFCKTYDAPENLVYIYTGQPFHRECARRYQFRRYYLKKLGL